MLRIFSYPRRPKSGHLTCYLNRTYHVLTTRPVDWGGELRSPAFIVLHVITHAFHHKGQIVAMLRILGYPAPDTDLQQA
jgi:uncharacterized damage-inducible protein DinB